ncbi:Auxin-responsive protein IAA27 [Raphanus sativus]|uniref:Auxin-responsive protein n=1 Tax=Raphanus sativus TaxID=3726 RepID=A0A6J0MJ74_RAPSA|nr:auxin-responsive protein IAA27 [Raphanus sativus]KAJ4913379.1 Auxin-responsive protein IAA27 [Raphanus sativus]
MSESAAAAAAAEHGYRGLSEFPTMEATQIMSDKTEDNNNNDVLNFKATELRLGLPGSESPERVGFMSLKSSCPVSGAKRVFSDAINGSTKWVFSPDVKDIKPAVPVKEKKSSAPASKAQVVGWPPIRSFRKNTMASSQSQKQDGCDNNNNTETEGCETKSGPEPCLYVKVSMEGAPYLRKIDLKTYKSYVELSSALEKMFSCFTIGQFGSHGGCGRDGLNESRLTDLLRGSEYVVTYEDKDSDWMLVGDVPWEMFICSCKKLRIMKSSEAIGLAPRVMEKCRSRN